MMRLVAGCLRWSVLAVALCLVAVLESESVRAQDMPECSRQTVGTVTCMSTKLCTCSQGQNAGYRWDCGILRPRCADPDFAPATLNRYDGPYPSAIAIDRSDNSTSVNQSSSNSNSNSSSSASGSGAAAGQ